MEPITYSDSYNYSTMYLDYTFTKDKRAKRTEQKSFVANFRRAEQSRILRTPHPLKRNNFL